MTAPAVPRMGWAWALAASLGLLPILFWIAGVTWVNQPAYEHQLSLGEQGVLVLAVYGIKLAYMLLALAAAAVLWKERGTPWRAALGSLIAFWIGEFFCAINILFFKEEALVFEYLHSLFMVYCVGLLFYAVMEAADESILKFSDPKARCALVGVCKDCSKGASTRPCLLHRLFAWMIPLGALLALMPLMAQPLDVSFNTTVFGVSRTLTHLMPIQWYELRFSPAAGLALLVGAWLALVWQGGTVNGLHLSKVLLSNGMGLLGFSFMRLAFAAFYRENLVWFVFWEELTELLLVVGVLVVALLLRPGKFARLRTLVSG